VKAPDWVHAFSGIRIIVPDEAQNLLWAGGVSKQGVRQAAQIARQLAEGQEVRAQSGMNSGWVVIVYIAAGLFGLEFLLGITAMVFSAFIH
jgi:UDP-N-acetylenolpyruvoylglucosamine reductase